MGQLEVTKGLHLLLEVVLGNPHQPLAQLGGQLGGLWRAEQAPFVEQLVEQDREAGDLLGNHRAGRAEGQQALQRAGVLGQQHQVGRTPRHRLHQRQDPLQHHVRPGRDHGQQARHEGIQALPPETLHGSYLGAVAQIGQALPGRRGIDEAGVGQLPAGRLLVQRLLPQRDPLAADAAAVDLAVFVLVRVGDHLAEVPVDARAPVVQVLVECGPVGEAHDEGHADAVVFVAGQHLRLPVGQGLEGMLGVAQELVALAQLRDHRRRQVALPLEGRQHLQQRPLLQAQVAPAVDQLEGLGDELHLADAAFAQLDVLGHPLAPDLLLDQLLHGAQRLDGGKVQVAPIDERPQHAQQLLASLLVAADHPRLDHRVALPVAALVLVVLLQRGEAVDQRAAGAVGAQAHVDAEDEAVDGDGIQRLDQLLPQAGEELLVVQRPLGALGLAALGVTEDQVDVRRQVEFPRAQLAHAQDHHPLRLAGAPADGRAELLAVAPVEPGAGTGRCRRRPGPTGRDRFPPGRRGGSGRAR